MAASERLEKYMDYLSAGLGHSGRDAELKVYCTGLMLPLACKSVEPLAARVDPMPAVKPTLPLALGPPRRESLGWFR